MPPCANIFVYMKTSIIESSYSDHKLTDFVQKKENKVFHKYAELFIFDRRIMGVINILMSLLFTMTP